VVILILSASENADTARGHVALNPMRLQPVLAYTRFAIIWLTPQRGTQLARSPLSRRARGPRLVLSSRYICVYELFGGGAPRAALPVFDCILPSSRSFPKHAVNSAPNSKICAL
jgi:hypothetical protein